MWIPTFSRGSGGICSQIFFDKNGAIWYILGVPKYVIINLKITNFKDNKSTTTKIMRHIFSHVHVSTTINTITFYKVWGGGGGSGGGN